MPVHALARDVFVIFVFKAILIVAAAILVFGPRQRPSVDAGIVATRLIDAPSITRPSEISPP